MGLLGKVLSAGLKTVALPFVIIGDTERVMDGDEIEGPGVLGSALEDVVDGLTDPLGICDDDDDYL